MIRRLVVILALAFVLAIAPAAAREYAGWKAEVEKLIGSGDYGAAMAQLESVKAVGEPDADFYFLRAKAHSTAGRFDRALADVDRALSMDPLFPEAVGHKAIVQLNLGDPAASLKTATQALKMTKDADLYYVRGAAYSALGRYAEALDDLNSALVLAADRPDLLIARGEVAIRLKKFPEALRDYNRAIELAPEDPRPYLGRGGHYLMTGEHDKARRDLDRCVELNPNFALGYLRRGTYWKIVGDGEAALADLRKASDAMPQSEEAWLERTLAEMATGHFDPAEQGARHLLKISRNNGRAHKILGTVLLARGRREEAVTHFGKALAKNPQDVESLYLRGTANAELKNYTDALRDFDRAAELLPGYLDPLLAKAGVFLVQNKPEKALEVYSAVLAKHPDNILLLRQRSELLKAMGRFDEALRDLRRVKQLMAGATTP